MSPTRCSIRPSNYMTATAPFSPANDNWKSDQQTEIEATGIPPTDHAESAIVMPLAPGAYTAIEIGKNDTSGVGLVEVYNLH